MGTSLSADAADPGRYTLTIEVGPDGDVRCYVEAAGAAPGACWTAAIEVDPADPLVARALQRARGDFPDPVR